VILTQCLSSTRSRIQDRHGPSPVRYDAGDSQIALYHDSQVAGVTTETPVGDDVDLAQEDVRLADGTRLTPEVAQNVVEQARSTAGRPSLSGMSAKSPQIAFRVATTLRDRAAAVAAQEGKTFSQLAREALEERIAHTR